MNRRGFLFGLSATIFAPSIVRASSLMPVKAVIRSGIEPMTGVDADNQVGHQMIITPAHCGMHVGDIITFAGVYAMDRYGDLKDCLREFVVTAAVPEGTKILSIYPPIIPGGFDRATVNECPKRWAPIRVSARASPTPFA